MIYLITVNYYSVALITRLSASLPDSATGKHQLIIVNNSSDDDALQTLAGDGVFILEAGKNVGFGAACTLGIEYVYQRDRQAIVWLINPDAYLPENALEQAIEFFYRHPELSIVGTVVYEPSGSIWFAGGGFVAKTGTVMVNTGPHQLDSDYFDCDWVTGCSLLLNLQRFNTCPQFNPAYFLYYEDFEFCQRYASQGHSVGVATELSVIHTPSAITDRNTLLKLKHSTYSYLLTLERYTNGLVLSLRLLRIVLYALVLIPLRPQQAIGKFSGVLMYCKRVAFLDPSSAD